MPKSPVVVASEHYVTSLMTERLTSDHRYHNLPHTLKVRDACLKIGKRLQLDEEELEILELAALFHDTGFVRTYQGHEAESRAIARDFLDARDYPEEKLRRVLDCIDATVPAREPKDQLQEIIKDADLANLANEAYLDSIEALRHEWWVFLGQEYDENDWRELNFNFLKAQDYYTPAARELFGPRKDDNRKMLKKMVKKDKKKKDKSLSEAMTSRLANSRSAQMMFKTALRNHLDLSNLADNKANIMLSVNALIITIAMPVAASYIGNHSFVIIPMGVLLATCLVSMVYATLATRPIRMTGETDPAQIHEGNSNLFFFGNFYKMSFDQYQEGMEVVLENEKKLEGSIMRDLYYLGHSLGRKYYRLRICYNVFMVGIILAVLSFVVSYWRLAG